MLTYQVNVTIATVPFESFVLIPDLMEKFRPKVSILSRMIINSLDEIIRSMFLPCYVLT